MVKFPLHSGVKRQSVSSDSSRASLIVGGRPCRSLSEVMEQKDPGPFVSGGSAYARSTTKRAFDVIAAAFMLLVASPLLLVAAIGIKMQSKGPIIFLATRLGAGGVPFKMLKFRSMHTENGGPVITARGDVRVFAWGRFIRRTKIDELPQFWNVIRGDMSIVGPRPEDPKIVNQYYSRWMREVLEVRPGVTSPGSLFYFTRGEGLVDCRDPEGSYIRTILKPRIAIELGYIKRANMRVDFAVMVRTLRAIFADMFGRPSKANIEDIRAARFWVATDDFEAFL